MCEAEQRGGSPLRVRPAKRALFAAQQQQQREAAWQERERERDEAGAGWAPLEDARQRELREAAVVPFGVRGGPLQGVRVSGCRVEGRGFQGRGSRVLGVGSRVSWLGVSAFQGLGFGVEGGIKLGRFRASGFQGVGCRV